MRGAAKRPLVRRLVIMAADKRLRPEVVEEIVAGRRREQDLGVQGGRVDEGYDSMNFKIWSVLGIFGRVR